MLQRVFSVCVQPRVRLQGPSVLHAAALRRVSGSPDATKPKFELYRIDIYGNATTMAMFEDEEAARAAAAEYEAKGHHQAYVVRRAEAPASGPEAKL